MYVHISDSSISIRIPHTGTVHRPDAYPHPGNADAKARATETRYFGRSKIPYRTGEDAGFRATRAKTGRTDRLRLAGRARREKIHDQRQLNMQQLCGIGALASRTIPKPVHCAEIVREFPEAGRESQSSFPLVQTTLASTEAAESWDWSLSKEGRTRAPDNHTVKEQWVVGGGCRLCIQSKLPTQCCPVQARCARSFPAARVSGPLTASGVG
ncbi:hypothetical protein F5Y15DRAFT_227903 [Xylariaceae sp. FL0016]|nr:hypothetical protein F5Y15DRAFT_227903 [Xylariaceae sp. FL0016]